MEQSPLPGRKGSTKGHILLADLVPVSLLALAFVAVQTILLDPPVLYDPIEYFLQASRLPHVQPHHRSLRIGLLLPVRTAQSVFGYSEFAYYAVPYLAGVTLSISTYVLSRAYWRRSISFAAGLVVVLNPYVMSQADQIYPDLLGIALFTAACAALVWGSRLLVERTEAALAVRLTLVAGGILLGWSYLVREVMVILFPLVLLIVWWERLPLRLLTYVAVPALAMFGGELLYNGIYHGDLLARPRALLQRGGLTPSHAEDLVASRRATRGSRLDRLGAFPRLLLHGEFGPVFLVLVPAALVGAASERSRRMLIPVAWLLWYWAFVTALGVFEEEIGQNILRIDKLRYWYVVFPPLAIAGIGGSEVIARRAISGHRRLTEVAVTVLVGGVVLYVAVALYAPVSKALDPASGPNAFRQLRSWLSTPDARQVTTIWTTQRTAWVSRMYVRTPAGSPIWDGRVRSINTARNFLPRGDLTDGVFLLNDDFFKPRHSNWREATPDYLVDPPDDWSIAFASDGSELIVYAIDAGHQGNTDEIVIGNSTKRWLFRPRTSGAGEQHRFSADPSVDLRVESGDRATVGSGELSMSALHGDDVLRMHLDIGAEGPGNVVPYCFFKDADGTRMRVLAATAWGLPAPPGTVELVCAVPDGLAESVSVIVGASLIGPVDVQLGTLRIERRRDLPALTTAGYP